MTSKAYLHRGGSTPLLGETIPDHLAAVAGRNADREALVSLHQGERWSYQQLFSTAERLALGLLAMGVERGDRVGIWAVNCSEWLLVQIATASVGAVLVNINPACRLAELEHALTAARVQTLFLMPAFRSSRYVEMLHQLAPELLAGEDPIERLPDLDRVVVFDPTRDGPPPTSRGRQWSWDDLLELGGEVDRDRLATRAAELDVDDPINIQFTSGTTGFPKPVVLTHHNILNNAHSTARAIGLRAGDRLCVPVPFYHCFGMVVSSLGCLSHGATLVLPAPHFEPGAILRTIEAERCTVLHGVPTMFVAELEHPDFASFDLSSLRTGIMAGAPCPPELLERVIDEMGLSDIRIGYGQTEASPVTHCTLAAATPEQRTRTVGVNLPHQEVKLVDPASGTTVARGAVGEVCFRGYHVMRGYYRQPEATAEAIDDAGWLHSGDLGVMEADGSLRITGRLKEMVIRGGENIYPAEVEALLDRHPKVAQSAVFGVPHPRWGEDLGAWVQLHAGEVADAEELLAWLGERLSHFKVPRTLRVVDDFPMTVSGKIQKFRIREIEMERGVAADSASG